MIHESRCRARVQQNANKRRKEWLTAFNTRYDQFEYLVMSFELCNASSTFQSYINNSLQEYLNHFIITYLNDVLIYSETEKEHHEQVLKVLRWLRERDLQLNIDKCEFSISEIKYLEMYIDVNEIRMNPKKIETIKNWATPTIVKEVQSFLELANFYRQFILEYSNKVKCLIELTREEHYETPEDKKRTRYDEFVWTDQCQSAFEELKEAFSKAPILAHYDPSLKTWVETNASDFVVTEILSQMHDDVLKPVVYFSQKLTSAKCNYMIYDKKLLAIVKSFENWKSELIETRKEIKIYIDHKNLQYFMTIEELNRRQVRWAEFLSEFGFRIMYRPGKQEGKPDALTRIIINVWLVSKNDWPNRRKINNTNFQRSCWINILNRRIDIVYDSIMKFISNMNQKNCCESFVSSKHVIDEIAFNIVIHFLKKIEKESIAEPQSIIISSRIFTFMMCRATATIKWLIRFILTSFLSPSSSFGWNEKTTSYWKKTGILIMARARSEMLSRNGNRITVWSIISIVFHFRIWPSSRIAGSSRNSMFANFLTEMMSIWSSWSRRGEFELVKNL